MTAISRKTVAGRSSNGPNTADSTKARLFLAVACLWPLCLLALFAASAPHVRYNNADPAGGGSAVGPGGRSSSRRQLGLQFRNILDRVDVMGYGPTHPRVAFALVGTDLADLETSVDSIFAHTDRNRLFIITVVVEGYAIDAQFVDRLTQLDRGTTKHWHGLRPDIHSNSANQSDAVDDHADQKIHVIFNAQPLGLAQARQDAVSFIQILEDTHEAQGLKSHEEDLILVLMQGGTRLVNEEWLTAATNALIVPPPILGNMNDASSVALKLANAVAFNLEGHGQATAFDAALAPLTVSASAQDISLSNGDSYPTPALNVGAAVAMRLHTYINLPISSSATAWKSDWAVNLDLSLALWLCADGIDMVRNLDVTRMQKSRGNQVGPLDSESAALIAASWMDDVVQRRFLLAHSRAVQDKSTTRLEWETMLAHARAEGGGTARPKCRSFDWYVNTINTELIVPLQEAEAALQPRPKDEPQPPPIAKVDPSRPRPTKPLCAECLEIVQKAKPVDISFVDVSNGNADHPHKGAVDADGQPGYIHDETALRKSPESFDTVDPMALKESCLKRDNTYNMLKEKVYVDMEYDASMQGKEATRPKIFCLVYTISSFHERIHNIRKTWGPKCDGFMVGSNLTDTELGTVNIVHDGPEEYNNIWQKVRSMWSYIYDNYYDKYDWFHIGGDDYFLMVENLRYYLESEEIRTAQNGGIYLPSGDEKVQTPMFLGRRFAYMGDRNDIFNSGGSGYTLNKAALKTMVVDGFPTFFPNLKTFSEDTMVAKLLRQYDILPYDTKDEAGGERYMPFMPGHHYSYRLDKSDWYTKYSINIKTGVDHCAARSVAFHYVKEQDMVRLHAMFYKLCPQGTVDF